MKKTAVFLAIALLAFLLVLLPGFFKNTSFQSLERVQQGNVSILLLENWLRADLSVAVAQILEDYPEIREEYQLGLLEIKMLAGTTEAPADIFLLSKCKGEIDPSTIILQLKRIITDSGGKITSAKRLSKSEVEIVAYFKETEMKTLYFFRQEDGFFWEFFFSTPKKDFLFKQGSFRKIYRSLIVVPQSLPGTLPA